MTRARPLALVLVLVLTAVLAGCTGPDTDPDPVPSPPETPSTPAAAPSTAPDDDVPPLAAAPGAEASLWLDTIGIPVVAAVRTSTPLADLAEVPDDERPTICRQVATDLDGIASPQALTGLAITADAETATLLVADLQAKAELLASCGSGGDELDALAAEVAHTHAVAVAWLDVLGGGG